MLTYITRRLLLMIPTLLGITMLVFFIMALSPGSVTTTMRSAEGDMRPEERKRVERDLYRRYALDKPLIVQYGRWLNNISPIGFKYAGSDVELLILQRRFEAYQAKGMTPAAALEEVTLRDADINEDVALGDGGKLAIAQSRPGAGFPETWHFGFKRPYLGDTVVMKRPVWELIRDAMPATLLLNLLTIPITYMIAITSGIYAAKHRGKLLDVGTSVTFIGLYSLPGIWVGVMLVGYFASRDYFQWFPTGGLHDITADSMAFLPSFQGEGFHRGWLLDTLWHLVLPIVCLTYGSFAFLSKLMRASVLENLTADFARTARAKGLPENIVLFRHVLSNSILPLITVAASILPGLLGGSLVVESIFSINGMGRLMIEAIRMKEQALVLSETCVVGAISLVCLIIADICYAIADPRVSYE